MTERTLSKQGTRFCARIVWKTGPQGPVLVWEVVTGQVFGS